MENKNIYLIGMPGAGKTTLGKELAVRIGWKHQDLDDLIEAQMNMTVPEIFRTFGEDRFRAAEQRALHEVSGWHNRIVSTGGGTPCFFDNIKRMNRTGTSVFLDVPVETLYNRIVQDVHVRPLLKNQEHLRQTLTNTLSKRRAHYEQATIHLTGESITVEDMLALLTI